MDAQPFRVLIVDDDAVFCDTLVDALELEGYECRLAANGQAALSMLSLWSAHIIVLDLIMPVMDGWTFRRAQRTAAALREIPVVIVSVSHPHAERDRDLAPAAIISKPFELGGLFDTLQGILREPSTSTSTRAA